MGVFEIRSLEKGLKYYSRRFKNDGSIQAGIY
jgi:hypothetical protein